jgi:hypothetical protein
VFLTPLKPPTKASISAEAIQSSLYYFHIPTPADEVVKESLEEHRQSWSKGQDSWSEAVHRKPLPSTPYEQASTRKHFQNKSESHSDFPTSIIGSEEDTPAGRHFENTKHVPRRSLDGSTAIARKPVGPRPINARLNTADSKMIERRPVGSSGAFGREMESAWTDVPSQNSVGNVGTHWPRDALPQSIGNVASDHPLARPPLPQRPSCLLSEDAVVKDFRVTIIRRDPTSGSQWNIGGFSKEQRPALMERDWLKIEITTPGYRKFARQVDSRAPTLQTSKQAIAEHKNGTNAKNASTIPDKHGSTSMSVAPVSTHFEPMPFARDITLSRLTPSHRPKSSHHHQRSNSSDSFPISLSKPLGPISSNAQPHLTFLSPWQGTCTFTTGMDGRSLKCRHKLPSSNTDQSDSSALVAEVRFNLPWSALGSRDTNAGPSTGGKRPNSLALLGEDTKHSFRKGMARIRQEINSTSSDSEIRTSLSTPTATTAASHQTSSISPSFRHDDDHPTDSSPPSSPDRRLDLSLGRERAGGGRKGKSAKLGKLVLRDEGLKMADLVVAACMGVWWDVYSGRGGME